MATPAAAEAPVTGLSVCTAPSLAQPSFKSVLSREPGGAHGVGGGTLFREVGLNQGGSRSRSQSQSQHQSWGSPAGLLEAVTAVLHWEPGLRPAV